MKKVQLFCSLALILFSSGVFAQADSEVKSKPTFELGMNIYGLTLRAGDFYTQYHLVWDNQVFSGIYLKKYIGKNAWRTSIEYSRRAVHFGNKPYIRYAANRGELASLELKFGFQRLLGTKKFAPYLFADAEYTRFRTLNYPRYDYYYLSSIAYPYPYNNRFYTLSGNYLSLSPGIGLRWSVFSQVFINAEASAQLFFARERTGQDYTLSNSIGINARPLKISMGFNF